MSTPAVCILALRPLILNLIFQRAFLWYVVVFKIVQIELSDFQSKFSCAVSGNES